MPEATVEVEQMHDHNVGFLAFTDQWCNGPLRQVSKIDGRILHLYKRKSLTEMTMRHITVSE